jgi:hypothetical protein
MFKLKSKEDRSALPAPVALTPDQLQEMARLTAGGLSLASAALITRAGPYPPMPYLNLGAVAVNVIGQ